MTPNPAPTVEQIAAMDDKLNVDRLRALSDSATPELLSVSARVMGNMLRLGGEHQRPRAKDWESANYDADGLLVSHLLNSLPAILAMAEDNARLREALGKMRTEAVLLLNNAEGCAANHYGSDFRMLGMPQWLLDARENIASASAPLRALADQERQS